ncbi:MAG: glycosyl hydrolase family 8 [Acidimicrobiales bacterium]
MSRRRAVLVVVVALVVAACGDSDQAQDESAVPDARQRPPLVAPEEDPTAPEAPPEPDDDWRRATDRFVSTYVDDDGRVVRHDQGGDTVSEGQAYAMLLAAAAEDEQLFDRVWDWTAENLQGEDALLAWRWADGAVVDDEFATDADLDAAHALVLASIRFDRPDLAAAADEIAAALLDQATIDTADGTVLVAGRWARGSATVNPSYFAPLAFSLLYRHHGDERWAGVASTSRSLVDSLTAGPPHLAPDWAVVDTDGPTVAGSPPETGYDAIRVPWRFGLDCDESGRALAARSWPFFAEVTESGTVAPDARYDLQGQTLPGGQHAAATAAAAMSARAAGEDEAARRLLDLATAQDDARPSYYGSALVALTRVAAESDGLGTCPDG